ncbi:heme exporter protein B [Paucidesulfovibrio gracilis DSM 16080]|uniref:Heme exporter protein B n=1 Tax=Paucidesulfovibrio gracilis DSM 16080 TaxID=1121449 RepID=A0A1T4W0V3_9BACT|nr:heme exporter protein CcmB [Paucidesulfovibrio gracilis]SKA70882.1 heme exporter protein B [Paucidesulfovibrio gracilis DSM 16080]
MLKRAVAVASKDWRLSFSGGQGVVQAVLLGLLLIFLFSLAYPEGQAIPPQAAAAVFWLASAFGLVLVFNGLFSLEEAEGARLGLLSSPAPRHSVWLGKAVAGFALLLLSQLIFFPGIVVFLGQDVRGPLWLLGAAWLGADVGLVVLGALLGALAQGQAARESLLSVIVFPLLIPALLAGITLFAMVLSGMDAAGADAWLGLLGAFDALYAGAALLLFPFVYGGEE